MVFSDALASLETLNLVVAVVVAVVVVVVVVVFVVVVSKVVSVFILIIIASPSVVVFPQGFELEGPASLVRQPLPIVVVVVVVQKYVVVPLKVSSCCRDLPGIGCHLIEVEGLFWATPGLIAKLLSAFGNGGVRSR